MDHDELERTLDLMRRYDVAELTRDGITIRRIVGPPPPPAREATAPRSLEQRISDDPGFAAFARGGLG